MGFVGEFYVQRECWTRWPKVLIMKRKTEHGDEAKRYIPERTCRIIEDGYMDDPAVCSYCGTHYDGGRYCKHCGARVLTDEEQGHLVADAIRRLEEAAK